MGESLAALLVPARCAACGTGDVEPHLVPLCRRCRAGCRSPLGPCCPRCGADWSRGPCGRCARFGEPFAFESAVALWRYRGPVRQLVHRFKYRGRADCLPGLGRTLARSPRIAQIALAATAAPHQRLVVPVPLGPRARRRRGYNQAELLARGLADALGLPLQPRALLRRREGGTQVGSGRRARARRTRGAFAARPALVEGRAVLLVDDVLSTGSTAQAAARALRRGGARCVDVVTLAT